MGETRLYKELRDGLFLCERRWKFQNELVSRKSNKDSFHVNVLKEWERTVQKGYYISHTGVGSGTRNKGQIIGGCYAITTDS